eukprot:scaffold47_cov172-Ochromonas_danica.AAC.3
MKGTKRQQQQQQHLLEEAPSFLIHPFAPVISYGKEIHMEGHNVLELPVHPLLLMPLSATQRDAIRYVGQNSRILSKEEGKTIAKEIFHANEEGYNTDFAEMIIGFMMKLMIPIFLLTLYLIVTFSYD